MPRLSFDLPGLPPLQQQPCVLLPSQTVDAPFLSRGTVLSRSHSPTTFSSVDSEPLPNGWLQIYDPDGRPFYHNLLTRESQWHRPSGSGPPTPPLAAENTVTAFSRMKL